MRFFILAFSLSFLMLGSVLIGRFTQTGVQESLTKYIDIDKIVFNDEDLGIISTNSFQDGFVSFTYQSRQKD